MARHQSGTRPAEVPAFTLDPSTGAPGAYGDYLPNAQGEDIVAGIRNTLSLDDLKGLQPQAHAELMQVMRRLEKHHRDLCDIEFTIERGKLWMLQTRVGKRTAAAAFPIARDLEQQVVSRDLRRAALEVRDSGFFSAPVGRRQRGRRRKPRRGSTGTATW